MKRTLGLILALLLVLSLFACGKGKTPETGKVVETETKEAKETKEQTTIEGHKETSIGKVIEYEEQKSISEVLCEPVKELEKDIQELAGVKDDQEPTPPPEETTEATPEESPARENWFAVHWKLLLISLTALVVILLLIIAFLLKKRKTPEKPAVLPGDPAPYGQTDPPGADAELPLRATVKVARVHNVGKRKNQEDSFGVSNLENDALCTQKGIMAVVADGMGGLKGGEDVSSLAVLSMLKGFSDLRYRSTGDEELKRLLNLTVNEANQYLMKTVGFKKSGSTLMAVIVSHGMLSWLSVGDSRIALFRNGKLIDLNQRHVFGAELDELVRQNRISAVEAMGNPNRDKLTSYIGMGDLKYVDASSCQLIAGDKIILMSDGIFNTLSDPEIEQILGMPTDRIGETLENAVLQKNNPHQDNFTAVVLEIPGK